MEVKEEKKVDEVTEESEAVDTLDEGYMIDVSTLPISDLVAMYTFVVAQANTNSRYLNSKIKAIMRNRQVQVEAELSMRCFGFVLADKYSVVGQKPEDVIKGDKFVNLNKENKGE